MTITRVWQAGNECDTTNSHNLEFTRSNAGISDSYAKTGTYSMRCFITGWAEYDPPLTHQLRTGFHYLQYGVPAASAYICSVKSGSVSYLLGVRVKDDSNLALLVNDVEVDTYEFDTQAQTFYHFGLDCNVDSSSGWAYLYIDGIQVMSACGNTGSANIDRVRYGGQAGKNLSQSYFDDLFIDDTTGQGAPAPVPDRRFYPITPNGIGNYNDGTPSAASSHYLLVDDRPYDSDTSYIVLSSASQKETYAMTSVCPPAGFSFASVIPFYIAKKTDAEVATELAMLMRSTSGSSDVESSACNLGTSYSYRNHRYTTNPSGGAWTQAEINDIEIGYQGEGAF